MSIHQEVALQYSTGYEWVDLWTILGTGTGNDPWGDSVFVSKTVNLPETGEPYQLRFVMRYMGSVASQDPVNYAGQKHANGNFAATGFFFDDVVAKNVTWLDVQNTVVYPSSATQVRIDSTTLGADLGVGTNIVARVQPQLGCRYMIRPGYQSVSVTLTPLSGWEGYQAYDQPGIGGFDADDDGDGLPNGLEYGFGTNPSSVTSEPEITAVQEEGQITMCVAVDSFRSDVSYGGQVSTDMVNWEDIPADTTNPGTVKIAEPSDGTLKFLRFKVSLNGVE